MELTIGYHCQQQHEEIQGFLSWINSLKTIDIELIVVDDREQPGSMETLSDFSFESHVQLKVISF